MCLQPIRSFPWLCWVQESSQKLVDNPSLIWWIMHSLKIGQSFTNFFQRGESDFFIVCWFRSLLLLQYL
ncbi:uncharacterized protein DS421_3g90750 [Arachis hypogaea]|nr:uncharacterized protein DS421_3g90750 [Arachis hypogaea]QHO58456.1 uncharacterized protein DS421_3g90750 [Arachis hypogaea]